MISLNELNKEMISSPHNKSGYNTGDIFHMKILLKNAIEKFTCNMEKIQPKINQNVTELINKNFFFYFLKQLMRIYS